MLSELFKNTSSLSNRSNYRDMIWADDSGKALGKLLRLLLMARAIVMGTQFGGGLNRDETAFTHLYIQLIVDPA